MKPSEIHVGYTYVNRNAGRTRRKVLAIGDEYRPEKWYGSGSYKRWYSSGSCKPCNEPGVLFALVDERGVSYGEEALYLSSFAKWAGSVWKKRI